MVLEDYLNKTFEKEDKEYSLLGSKTNKGNQTQERKHRKLIASLAVNLTDLLIVEGYVNGETPLKC